MYRTSDDNERNNENGRNGFQIDAKLVNRHVAVEIGFMHAAKRTKEMAQPLHIPSALLVWLSRQPSPLSSRAHSLIP